MYVPGIVVFSCAFGLILQCFNIVRHLRRPITDRLSLLPDLAILSFTNFDLLFKFNVVLRFGGEEGTFLLDDLLACDQLLFDVDIFQLFLDQLLIALL